MLATAGMDKTIKLWDLRDGGLTKTLTGHDAWVSCVRFGPDGKSIFSSQLGDIRQWDVASGTEVGRLTIDTPAAWFYGLAVSSDGKLLATANSNGTALLMSVAR